MTGLEAELAAQGLAVLGGFYPTPDDALPGETLLLIGPDGANFWPHFTQCPEWANGRNNPVDRWSTRILSGIATAQGGTALFPFGGPPYHPFYQWALRSGQVWASPVALLVHATQGLFVSYRGALVLPRRMELATAATKPCAGCAKPCLGACPAHALTGAGYDVPRCHDYLSTPAGQDCMVRGCAVRRACPVGQNLRSAAQSAYHMQRFHA
ncbi:MAG: ferredoxin [Paracoccaceae bacterium]